MTAEIAKIRKDVSSSYSIDIDKVASDGNTIASAISSTNIQDARDLFEAPFATRVTTLVENLETDAFESYRDDPDVRDRLIEQNLDDATRYLQYCLAIRKEYSDLAKLYVDTRLKSEEFFRLDDIHQQEVKAGLYELNYSEATDEDTATTGGLSHANEQLALISKLNAEGPLKTERKADYYAASGQLSEASTNVNAPVAKAKSSFIAEYRSLFDQASWDYSALGINGIVKELTGRQATARRKAAYYKKDIGFRSARASVSRQLAYAQLAENARPGSILNYAERLRHLKRQFIDSLGRLIPRVKALQSAGHTLYGFSLANLKPALGHILNETTDWLTQFQDLMLKYKRRERTFLYSISLRKNISHFESNIKQPAGVSINFTSNFTGSKSGLIRGVAFEYKSGSTNSARPITVDVIIPNSVIENVGPHASAQPASLTCGRVLAVPNSQELRALHSDIVWNGSPYGTWTISVGSAVLETADIEDLILYVWMAFPS